MVRTSGLVLEHATLILFILLLKNHKSEYIQSPKNHWKPRKTSKNKKQNKKKPKKIKEKRKKTIKKTPEKPRESKKTNKKPIKTQKK